MDRAMTIMRTVHMLRYSGNGSDLCVLVEAVLEIYCGPP